MLNEFIYIEMSLCIILKPYRKFKECSRLILCVCAGASLNGMPSADAIQNNLCANTCRACSHG